MNGRVNLVLTNPRRPAAGGGTAPLTRGRLLIQFEGAEVCYRNLVVRRNAEFRAPFANPNVPLGTSACGTIRATRLTAREVPVGVRFLF